MRAKAQKGNSVDHGKVVEKEMQRAPQCIPQKGDDHRSAEMEKKQMDVIADENLRAIKRRKGFIAPRTVKTAGVSVSMKKIVDDGTEAKSTTGSCALYYRVLYTKRSKKKHKIYADGVVERKGAIFRLLSEEGVEIASRRLPGIEDVLGAG